MVMNSRMDSSFFSPMPETRVRSSTEAKGPLLSRSLIIFAAKDGPTPGIDCRSPSLARFTLIFGTVPDTLASEPKLIDAFDVTEPLSLFLEGTNNCSPSVRARARFKDVWSASSVNHPASLIASFTRAPSWSSYNPGAETEPATCTNIVRSGRARIKSRYKRPLCLPSALRWT